MWSLSSRSEPLRFFDIIRRKEAMCMGEKKNTKQDKTQSSQPDDLIVLTERIMKAHGKRDL